MVSFCSIFFNYSNSSITPKENFKFISLASQVTLSAPEQVLYNSYSFEELFQQGRFYKVAGDIETAMSFLRPALLKNPTHWDANWDLGDLYLANGDFKRGFAGFRLRWIHDTRYKKKLWRGENIQGKKLLVYCQWGLGDTFMFIRYAQCVKELGAQVIVYCQKPLKHILKNCSYIDQIVCSDDEIPDFDYQVPITFLPELFQTTVDSIPQNIPYLAIEEHFCISWKKKLADDSFFKIGICWHGENRHDPQTALRSLPLQKLIPLFKLPGVKIYNLQVGEALDEINSLPSYCCLNSFGPDFDKKNGAFVDTAAIMKNLDLVITIDTSIAHLAGGLGMPVWVLLPYASEWRYLLNRNDSPWYPTMKLFRQPFSGDWQSVMVQVVQTLSNLIVKKEA